MEFNEQIELTQKMRTDSQMENRMTVGGAEVGMEGWRKKEKGPMDTDHSVVIAGWRGDKGVKW